MNILRLNAYFAPEITAGSHLMNDIYEGFSKRNIRCKIITPEPTRGISNEVRKEYKAKRKEKLFRDYIEVERFPMINEGSNPIQRALRYMLCSVFHYYRGIREKDVDVIFSGSTPPTNGAISALVARKLSRKYKRKVRFVYELQDIFPDSLVNAKLTHEGSIIWHIGRKIEQYTYSNADKIVVPTESMRTNIIEKGVKAEKIEVISNWIDTTQIKPIDRDNNSIVSEYKINPSKFIVVYAGNFGVAQGADIVLKVAENLQSYKEIQFVIFGGGSYYEDAKKFVEDKKLKNVIINGLLTQERVSEVYSLGDIALITCKTGTGNAGMPSKTWSIMACNTPIIASFDTNSELAHVLEKSESGKCVEPENISQLIKAILECYSRWENGERKSLSSRKFVEKYASKDVCVSQYINVLTSEV